MTKITDIPAIRFKGFSDTWEQRKLGELALFNPKDELPQTFEYVDLESVVGTEMLSHRTEVKSSAPSRAQRLAHTGDLFYQTVRPYQKNNYLFEKPDNNYVFSTGYAQMRPYVDGYFLLSLVQSERFVKVVLDNCTGTSYPAINANDLAEIEVAAPSDESEARKIGTIFRSIDNLITLHQRKYDKLTNVKKSMLEKMFPQNGSNAPEIRFKGFTEAWEQRKFSDLVQIERGGSPRPIDDFITDSPDGLNWVKIGDAPAQGNYITKTAEKIKPEGLSKTREVHPGDLILSNSMSFGKPYIMGIDGCIHDGWLLIRNTYKVFDLTFLCHLLGTPQMIIQYKSLAAGSTVNNLNKELVGNTVVTIPTIKEQRVLGQYLETLDNLITLHQCKCQIDGCRFQSPLAITWEQRKVREVTDRYDNLRIPVAASLRVAGTTPYYGANGIQDYVDGYTHDGEFILVAEDGANDLKNYPVKCVKGRIWVNNHAHVLQGKYDCADNQFLAYAISQADIESLLVGGGRAKLNAETLMGIDLLLPNKAEQIRIGKYLAQLDNLITLHQCE